MGLWLALILCIMLSAFFSATETAFSACNRVKLKTVDGPRKEKAQIALGLLEKYDSLITTVLIGNNVVNIVGTAIATLLFTTRISPPCCSPRAFYRDRKTWPPPSLRR